MSSENDDVDGLPPEESASRAGDAGKPETEQSDPPRDADREEVESAQNDDTIDDDVEIAVATPLSSDSSHRPESFVVDVDELESEGGGQQSSSDVAATGRVSAVIAPIGLSPPIVSSINSQAIPAHVSEGAGINGSSNKMMARQARALSQRNRLGAGTKTAYEADMADIGALGIGLQLYFMLTKYLSFAFLIMGLISLPAIVVNRYGHGITSKMADPLQLAYTSLGNQGVNEAIVDDQKLCLPKGDIDCTWKTVTTPFTSDPIRVSWIITASDCVYSIFFLFFCVFFRYKVKQAVDIHTNENLTPAKYAVYVRGLPRDATEEEILKHFNDLYDLTKEEQYFPLWFGCCWGRRRRVKHSQSKRAINRNVVKNLDHLAGTTSITKSLYLDTWIAEVSVGHPTGGLLRTFLSMEALTQSIAETKTLIRTLKEEKSQSPATFKSRDEKLIHASNKKLEKLNLRLEHKKSKIKALRQATPDPAKKKQKNAQSEKSSSGSTNNKQQIARAKVSAAAKAAKSAATNTEQAFNWEACECAFVVFNNLESRRRCLQDYRRSASRLPRKFQPKLLRFRDGAFPLIVCPAPEPSNILWENLEVTDRGRFYRRSLTNFITFLLLLISAIIISAAQSAQQQFKAKMPPSGLCDSSLPQVFYASSSFTEKNTKWNLVWDSSATCSAGADDKTRYHISYANGIINPFNFSNPVPIPDPGNAPERCVEPCVSDASDDVCSTLPCFDQDLQDDGKTCETYLASHVLYCYCSDALATSIEVFGYVDGPKALWRDHIPCRGYIKDFLTKNGFIVMAAAVVIIVNMIMDVMLRGFANFERHSSESSKASGIAIKLFSAQFLNTAIIVLVVNASLGLTGVPVFKELLKGEYKDFERDWYPTVGMGITTTMLINAFMPQAQLFIQMFIISPLKRELKRRKIRTQEKMNKLYAGPAFDISSRYPMILNSVFVTMVFCGGSPVLLFIAAFAAAGTYWFDKLSIIHLYSVKTAYDEELGEVALNFLPWTLVLHLGFSTWMYGNSDLMKANLLDMKWVLKFIGLKSIVNANPDATNEVLYEKFLEESAKIDVLGKHGALVKILRSNVMLIFLFFVGTILCILLSSLWIQVVWPLLVKVVRASYRAICLPVFGKASPDLIAHKDGDVESGETKKEKKKKLVVIPEFTDYFRKSVSSKFRPDTLLGFERNEERELIRKWQDHTTLNGITRVPGQQMRTWEAMQAPTKTYAIEMNEKYQLAVAEIVAASKQLRLGSIKAGMVAPIVAPTSDDEGGVDTMMMAAVAATDAVVVSDSPATVQPPPDPLDDDDDSLETERADDPVVAADPTVDATANDTPVADATEQVTSDTVSVHTGDDEGSTGGDETQADGAS